MIQKKLAASILGVSKQRIKITASMEELKNAIRKADVRALIKQGKIRAIQAKGTSRGRARKRAQQKKKGRQQGHGKRRGTKNARSNKKENWINKIRLQRKVLHELKTSKKITIQQFRELYVKAHGGFFRSKRHLVGYIKDQQ